LLVEDADRLELASAPDSTAVVERFLDAPPPEPVSQAAFEVLAIVAYEQPVTRADISHLRGTDSSSVVSVGVPLAGSSMRRRQWPYDRLDRPRR